MSNEPGTLADQVRAVRDEIEQRLIEQISQAVEEFRERTGFGVHAVEVSMTDGTRMSDYEQRLYVGGVSFKVRL
jgi:hypothetical protein